jgi:hypothetical protein
MNVLGAGGGAKQAGRTVQTFVVGFRGKCDVPGLGVGFVFKGDLKFLDGSFVFRGNLQHGRVSPALVKA